MTIRIGIICPSNIAYRRFLPALKKCENFTYVGVAYATAEEWFGRDVEGNDASVLLKEKEKAEGFVKEFGGKVFQGYEELLSTPKIDAVYLPLPPALHFKWAQKALERGKHVFVEKPSTTCAADTAGLVELADAAGLALHENYMFIYHRQISEIQSVIASGELGALRLIRASFGFPFRGAQDFRYNRALGGGALLDCGGYTLRLARLLLGDTAKVVDGYLSEHNDFGVDLYGNAVLRNEAGLTAHIAFGMDNSYQCQLEVWGSKGCLMADRVFTPPADFAPKLVVQTGGGSREIAVEPDDQFYHSLQVFARCVAEVDFRKERYEELLRQIELVSQLEQMR
ncbi:gfo/Idh/MocA family oxidoreductase [Pseudoflavonifractor sp. 524-17]|uniref:Gfo/Idh/MocA family protein n=1 Tax=Pseudoflavonifractor sp. 524-17 TaxID=2304577 RepID=UPI00137B7BCD|nr:Gfo/Idh/MocA family oxidoreductase [Pseudoflavonifractor sp. 524-17]NCE65119.1 gfo/Idh/MocA family oxidoreductase [Pseudoflavonifractor sp. 524-17]